MKFSQITLPQERERTQEDEITNIINNAKLLSRMYWSTLVIHIGDYVEICEVVGASDHSLKNRRRGSIKHALQQNDNIKHTTLGNNA